MLDSLQFNITDTDIRDAFMKNSDIENVIKIYHKITYDGVDELGPQSYLYDLNVLVEKKNRYYYVYHYHVEEWFAGDSLEYELYDSYNISDKSFRPSNIKYMFTKADFDEFERFCQNL